MRLGSQLQNYIMDICSKEQSSNSNGNSNLSKMLWKTIKSIAHPRVYLLLKLALILAMTIIEESFSSNY